MAAVSTLPQDRVMEWLEELDRVAANAAALSPAVAAALIAVVDSVEAEDGALPQAAVEARLALASGSLEPYVIAAGARATGPQFSK